MELYHYENTVRLLWLALAVRDLQCICAELVNEIHELLTFGINNHSVR